MNEAETRAELIDPAIAAAGWGAVDGIQAKHLAALKQSILHKAFRGPGELTAKEAVA